jgi:hypothetical protein
MSRITINLTMESLTLPIWVAVSHNHLTLLVASSLILGQLRRLPRLAQRAGADVHPAPNPVGTNDDAVYEGPEHTHPSATVSTPR